MKQFTPLQAHDAPDKPHEECGVFGIATHGEDDIDVALETYNALFALQHRGQQSGGIAVAAPGGLEVHKGVGLIGDVFTDRQPSSLKGGMAVGHVQYSAKTITSSIDAQPLVLEHMDGSLAIVNNGSLTNAHALRVESERRGGIFQTAGDAEIIAYMVVHQRLESHSLEEAILGAMGRLEGAYSMIIMDQEALYAVRDPSGYRPLCIGRIGSSYVFASESCALDAVGAEFVRDVAPGELVIVKDGQLRSVPSGLQRRKGMCIFEFIYFARPDSVIDGVSVDLARQRAGQCLARADDVKGDVVVGVPDSGLNAAIGYSIESGLPYTMGLVKNRYIGRTFIQSTQTQRERSVKIKLNALTSVVSGKKVVLVDDSIVRGTTCAHMVSILREAGASEVHMRVSAPPFLYPCYYGTDIPSSDVLIAHNRTLEEITRIIGVDTLRYLKLEDLPYLVQELDFGCCNACFTGDYPHLSNKQ